MKRSVRSLAELGTRLAEARKAAGMTADLGTRAQLDRTAITKIESGSRNVDSLELSRIAAILRRPIDWFLVPPPPIVVSRRAALDIATEREADVQLELLARDVEQLVDMGALKLQTSNVGLVRRKRLRTRSALPTRHAKHSVSPRAHSSTSCVWRIAWVLWPRPSISAMTRWTAPMSP